MLQRSISRLLTLLLLSGLLVACAAPIRSDPTAFKLLEHGQIQTSKTQPFADCLFDGFSEARKTTTFTIRQQRRTDGVRVETLANSFIGVSADVKDDGSVAFYESTAMAWVSTEPEVKVFLSCIDKYK